MIDSECNEAPSNEEGTASFCDNSKDILLQLMDDHAEETNIMLHQIQLITELNNLQIRSR